LTKEEFKELFDSYFVSKLLIRPWKKGNNTGWTTGREITKIREIRGNTEIRKGFFFLYGYFFLFTRFIDFINDIE
jgi:hypothetical protein